MNTVLLPAQRSAPRNAGGSAFAAPGRSPRERISIDDNWRFIKDDPPTNTVNLLYTVIKPWILPTGNAFIKDPSHRFTRPAADRMDDVAYVQEEFDDGAWQPVTLPHDWAITGPFITTGPNGGMGRLPSAGVGWSLFL